MRIFIISAIIFAVLVGIVGSYLIVASLTEKDISVLVEKIESEIEEQNIKSAESTFTELDDKWKSTRNLLMSVSEHADLDRVEEHLENIGSSLKYANFEEAYKELSLFKILLRNIFLNSKPTLTNIL